MTKNHKTASGKFFTVLEQYSDGSFRAWSFYSGETAVELLEVEAEFFDAVLVMTENRYTGFVEPGEVK